ncbi:hypothetical protein [Sphingobacterium sp.]|uniref:hypothetical protein n=1 Tax=Sphingobacterium sp. TaxID=341027 RepID=UPI00258312DB|nr:hypothetical protein [Sphingobacterium sp.]WET67040.1 MAG: hypothetical protein P0Y57_14490 [Sphingobacterium sp.]
MKTIRDNLLYYLVAVLLLQMVSACNKSNDFKAKLDRIPQISNEDDFIYLRAYGIGDTLDIVGAFDREVVQVNIGDAENVPIAVKDSVVKKDAGNHDNKTILDRIRIIITPNMGVGPYKKVSLRIDENLTLGHDIEIFNKYGPESFKKPLELQTLDIMTDAGNVFLQCINGKGDLYWFDHLTKSIIHKNKTGTNTSLVTMAQLKEGIPGFTNFIAGSVNPQGTKLWFLAKAAGQDQFLEFDFSTGKIKVLNNGEQINATYEGKISQVKLSHVVGIYGGSKGNIYLRIHENDADAIAIYNEVSASVRYIFNYKQDVSSGPPNLYPGIVIRTEPNEIFSFGNLKILPDENTLYLFGRKTVSFLGEELVVQQVQLFDLETQSKLPGVTFLPIPVDNQVNNTMYPSYLGPFDTFRIKVNNLMEPSKSDQLFGWMPMPGYRLQTLLYQYYWGEISPAKYGDLSQLNNLPQWSVFNFKTRHHYLYAPGKLNMRDYHLDPYFDPDNPKLTSQIDELLNYDEDGHLYMTGNGRALILKTALR